MRTLRKAHPLLVRAACMTTVFVVATACVVSDKDRSSKADSVSVAAPATSPAATFDTADISAPTWAVDSADTAGLSLRQTDSAQAEASFKRISGQTANAALTSFGGPIPKGGSTALRLQILLDRAGFSPGVIDGAWGKNAAQAFSFFRSSGKVDSASAGRRSDSATLDKASYEQLLAAGGSAPVVTSYTVTAEDVKGPFVKIPQDVYEKAKLQCLCYASPLEALAEKFHSSPRLLKQLNPGVDLTKVASGTSLTVPNVADSAGNASGQVAKLIVSKTGFWTNAVDSSGRVLYHFPSTLGAGYDPSPTGDFKITGVAHNPAFHYQPTLFAEVPDSKPNARLPAGPNSPVGVAWMALSKPHYGIHGTSDPETIGYASSHGCVRLTNWDAERLSKLVRPGLPVVFQ
ncbi:MAG TPA: L,D-transpeptidase [Gemmatimonadaceae bacterium]|nr:L,D-transpeptidase [Gemmatimonadaceae bacterium]